MPTKLVCVTATIDLDRAGPCVLSWVDHLVGHADLYVVEQGLQNADWQYWGLHRPRTLSDAPVPYHRYQSREILGVVPAFAIGVAKALQDGADVVACFHDDLLIEQEGWDSMVRDVLTKEPQVGLCGFGGALGLGDSDIYQKPYHPMQLARQTFLSNMRHAEAHGGRETRVRRVSCLDGFSQIGRRDFWLGRHRTRNEYHDSAGVGPYANLFQIMQAWGVTHHCYDAMLGCFASRLGWEVYLLPVQVHHLGGQTAVADPRYLDWALQHYTATTWEGQEVRGDAALWTRAHELCYTRFRDQLPLRLERQP